MSENKKVGMYGETPRVDVGQFSICRQSDNSIWIEHETGEGTEFPESLLELAIKEFYEKHF